MRTLRHSAPLLLLTAGCAQPPSTPASEAATTAPPESTDRVAIAMSAAPPAISSAATIMDFDSTGNLVELRKGTNGWMCLPDDGPAPGNAPMCLDGPWRQWLEALMTKQAPAIKGLGISYMLKGGLAPSNTDPFAESPPAGATWIEDGPHLMIIVPDPAELRAFPTDPASGGPYVMWSGTPYVHLMVPSSPEGPSAAAQ